MTGSDAAPMPLVALCGLAKVILALQDQLACLLYTTPAARARQCVHMKDKASDFDVGKGRCSMRLASLLIVLLVQPQPA
eukprot:scaffold1111_cov253-Pinguiococcus_pyrenoidosus.AAC.2